MKEYYELKLNADYVLSLFQDAIDYETKGTRLDKWTDVILAWYEDQLENDELDWEITSIPQLVYGDITQSRMIIVTEIDKEFDYIDKLYEEWGIGSVESDDIARICYKTTDKDGHVIYLCQKEI